MVTTERELTMDLMDELDEAVELFDGTPIGNLLRKAKKDIEILSDKLYSVEEEVDYYRSELLMAQDEVDCLHGDIRCLTDQLNGY